MKNKILSRERKWKWRIQECIWLTAAADGHGVHGTSRACLGKAPEHCERGLQLLCHGWPLLVCSYCTTLCAHVDTARLCQVAFALCPGFWMKESSDVEIHCLRHWWLHVLCQMHLGSICQIAKSIMILSTMLINPSLSCLSPYLGF